MQSDLGLIYLKMLLGPFSHATAHTTPAYFQTIVILSIKRKKKSGREIVEVGLTDDGYERKGKT